MEHDVFDGSIEAYRAAYKESENIFARLSKSSGLSDAEYWALLMIREGVSTQSDISEQLCMSKQTINSAFRQLVKKGLVRLETIENNLRTKQIILTDLGAQFIKKHIDSVLQLEETVWYMMPEEERAALTRLTQKYNALIKAELKKK